MIVILQNGKLFKTITGEIYDFGEDVKTTAVKNFAEASKKIRNYIDKMNMGASTFTGGQVIKNGKQIARVSYNGRVWDMNDNEIKF